MHLERVWAMAMSIINIFNLSPLKDVINNQSPLQVPSQVSAYLNDKKGPIFNAPGSPDDDPFQCQYPTMVGWEFCSTPTNRECWLRRTSDWKQYDIHTNYEDEMPLGITRYYTLELNDGSWDADGLNFPAAKLFNNTYPGPWIQACWGDKVSGKIKPCTWDGVNGVSQCPIGPHDYFVYEFNVTQYGSSWYHSHYSVQYADGALGPLTFQGPSSAEWGNAINPPLIVTDWGHNTAFDAVKSGLKDPDILLNGRGNITNYNNTIPNTTTVQDPYSITFGTPQKGKPNKKYLLRVINTSFTRTFVFSIDNHLLRIASADFVPIYSYYNTSVLVGVGQRYDVIVEANPLAYNDTTPLPTDENYWIRTYIIACGGNLTNSHGYERNGILRYNNLSVARPSSQPWQNVSLFCADEAYTSLHPIVPWQVEAPISISSGEQFNLQLNRSLSNRSYPLAEWALDVKSEFIPMRVNYTNLTFFHLDNHGAWDPLWRIIPENTKSKDWVYLAIIGPSDDIGAHPIHLHGHDFALLEQAYAKKFNSSTLTLKLNNPPRRDVVLVPRDGYAVIAFKADNPGAWLVHCHIAFHIAEGLGVQMLERQSDANMMWPKGNSKAQTEAKRVCENWETWYGDPKNWPVPAANCSYANKEFCFQEDSGV